MLPLGRKGACTLRAIIPNVAKIEDSKRQSPLETPRRIKRTPDNPLVKRKEAFHSFAGWFLPWLGVGELEKAIVNIPVITEELENNTLDAVQALQKEARSLQKQYSTIEWY